MALDGLEGLASAMVMIAFSGVRHGSSSSKLRSLPPLANEFTKNILFAGIATTTRSHRRGKLFQLV